jgi:hypothetical protein
MTGFVFHAFIAIEHAELLEDATPYLTSRTLRAANATLHASTLRREADYISARLDNYCTSMTGTISHANITA